MNFAPNFVPGRHARGEPFPGESLLGFAHRILSSTVFHRLGRAMAASGIKCAPETLPTFEYDNESLRGLAELLDCDPISIQKRVLPNRPAAEITGAITFFGSEIRRVYRERMIRRVSPRALSLQLYHRAIWELRPFSFDPTTRELLLDTCPVCTRKLGWKCVHGPQHCEKCMNERRFHAVDLRDFPQALVEVNDAEALDFVTNLIDPDEVRRADARCLLPPAWQEFSNGMIFEAVIAMTTGLRMDVDLKERAVPRGRNLKEFATLTPELLALAGRAVIGSSKGFSNLAVHYRSNSQKRPTHYGKRKELGSLALLQNDEKLPLALREVFRQLINHEMYRADRSATIAAEHIELLPISRIAKIFRVQVRRLARMADLGHIKTVRSPGAGFSLVMASLADVLPCVEQLKDLCPVVDAARRLRVPKETIRDLANRGLIRSLKGPVVDSVGGEGYSIKSIEDLIRRLDSQPQPKSQGTKTALYIAARALDSGPELPWAAIIAAQLAGDVELVPLGRSPLRECRFAVTDVESFVAGVRKHMRSEENRENEWISAKTAEAILKVSGSLFYCLCIRRPDLFGPRRKGQRTFRRADVMATAQRYIFPSEVAAQVQLHINSVKSFLSGLGVNPAIVISLLEKTYYIYERTEVAEVLEARIQRASALPANSGDPRVELIRAVVGERRPLVDVVSALGIEQKVGIAWLKRWDRAAKSKDLAIKSTGN